MSSNISSTRISLNDFGPAQPGQFDFTILFEETIFSLVPSAILLAIIPFRIYSLNKKPRKVSGSTLHSSKLLFLAIFACIQIVLLVLQTIKPELRSRATIAAASLSFVDVVALCLLSHTEHINSIRPSDIINVYLLLTLPLDAARCRTLWLNNGTETIAAVFSSSIGVKILIIIAEAMEKRGILLSRYQNTSPEVTSGIYSRSFFWWLNGLMGTGFSKIISNEDLFPIDDEMTSQTLQFSAQKAWAGVQNKESPRALLWAMLKATRGAFAYGIFPRICLIGFRYTQPLLLHRTVEFAGRPKEPDSIGWGLTAAFGLVFTGLAIANGGYGHMSNRFIVSLRGALVGMVYGKLSDLSITALNESAAVTLMSSDTETICQGFLYVHEIWAVPIELAIAMYLLWQQLGIAFMAPMLVAILSTAGIIWMAQYIGNAQKVWIQGIQTRVDVTATMLAVMKGVKMLGFTDRIGSIIQNLRVEELKLSSLFRRLICVRVILANSTSFLAPFATFGVFVITAHYSGTQLNTSAAFTALSLITLLASPMNTLIRTIPMLNASLACFKRVQEFLNSESRRDHRLPLSTSSSIDGQSSVEGIELKQFATKPLEASSKALIVSQNASFGWTKGGPPVISDVSLTLLRAQFCFVIGPVGSGKSTLLKGLLGETPSSQGFVYSDSPSTAFVDQIPWVQNGTIQGNILGISTFDESWYNQVVHACALDADISKMIKGHATLVGSAGISLSGGQKSRLALARAVYAKKSLVILDDVFSGLDTETEEQVFHRLLGNKGLFRELGTTVLLVTHAVHRLPYADHIASLDVTGHVTEQGSFKELKNSGGYMQSLATVHKAEDHSRPTVEPSMAEKAIFVPANEVLEVETAELNRQTGDFAVYKYYFASIGWKANLTFFSLVILLGVSGKITEIVITYWTSDVKKHGNKVNGFYIGIYGMLVAVSAMAIFGGIWTMLMYMVPKSAKILHERLLSTVMAAPLYFFTSTDVGTTLNRFSQDMTVIDAELPNALIDLSVALVMATMGAILMCLSAGYFAATMPAVILVVWVLQKYYLRTSRQMRLLDLEAKSPLYSHFIESLSGLTTIRAFGWSAHFQSHNLKLLDVSQKPYYLLFCIQRWLALILDLLVAVLAVILMVLVVKLRASISGGFVGLALLNVMSFNESLADIIKMWTQLETSFGAIARLMIFSSTTANENLPAEIKSVPEDWPSAGAIEFSDISAAYTPTGTSIIKSLSLAIPPGEKLGICGRSGSGKSSLITCLFRMLELSEGTITIDGIDISTLPRQLVRERLNAIPQEPVFIRGSIRLNLDPHALHSSAALETALRKVQLYDLVLGRGGLDVALTADTFSHGQRQLFCLAQAILRKAKVVILDEVTGSVDAKNDEMMQRIIREEFHGCTIIAVAHRLDTILDFDRVVLLGGGEVQEMGVPGELLKTESKFRNLYYS